MYTWVESYYVHVPALPTKCMYIISFTVKCKACPPYINGKKI